MPPTGGKVGVTVLAAILDLTNANAAQDQVEINCLAGDDILNGRPGQDVLDGGPGNNVRIQ